MKRSNWRDSNPSSLELEACVLVMLCHNCCPELVQVHYLKKLRTWSIAHNDVIWLEEIKLNYATHADPHDDNFRGITLKNLF